ncbi:MAG: DUF2225 domain-containing protein [Ruminiclostridium sp.]|nr:DUF2225 domain-containing protein [Ruminiclostridium sp.]
MNENLYCKTIKCPICGKNFDITKVKAKGCRVSSRDTDFCVYYEDLNPLFYDIWVCEYCGYASQSEKFENINSRDAKILLEKLSPRWTKRSYAGERSTDLAIETFKLALLNLQVRNAKASEFAKICIRLAWLYRIKKDKKEHEFIQHALKYYSETYEKEHFPVEKLDEFTCLYMIGELSRRAGNYEDAIKWLSRLISSPEARKNPVLIEAARDQFQLVKEKLGS